mgnify:CR=1 FL=1
MRAWGKTETTTGQPSPSLVVVILHSCALLGLLLALRAGDDGTLDRVNRLVADRICLDSRGRAREELTVPDRRR